MSLADQPAFPRPGFTTDRKMPHVMATDGGYANSQQEGMTLRQHYAGVAMQGLLADPEDRPEDVLPGENCAEAVARLAVEHADALIRRLEATK